MFFRCLKKFAFVIFPLLCSSPNFTRQITKMPRGVMKNTEKKVGKRVAAAERKNKKAIASVLSGELENVVFARVEKSLGCGGFSLVMNDSSIGIGLVRRTTSRVSDKSIVICSAADHNASAKVQSYEIIGVLAPHDAQKMLKEKILSPHLLNLDSEEEEDFFEHEDEENDSDVDVDAI